MTTRSKGDKGEKLALEFLKKRGYRIIGRNFHSRVGEIDIIALEGNTLVFIEVKTRWSKKFGSPQEAVTPRKLHSIAKTANYYKILHPNLPDEMRIDVLAIKLGGESPKFDLIQNASG